jgi:hypothetical protein
MQVGHRPYLFVLLEMVVARLWLSMMMRMLWMTIWMKMKMMMMMMMKMMCAVVQQPNE